MNAAFVLAGLRTPFCRAGSQLGALDAAALGRAAVTALLTRTGLDPAAIDHVIFGCVSQPADSANVARVIALRSGIPESVPAVTVCRNCGSGMEAVTAAAEKIAAGQADLVLAGGVESMSRMPLLFPDRAAAKFAGLGRARSLTDKLRAAVRFRPRDFSPVVALKLGLTDPVAGIGMGETAERLAREFDISRAEQDEYALRSHQLASAAAGALAAEIAPVHVGGSAIVADNGVRSDSTLEKLGRLKPVFEPVCGTVTAGNSSQISDGAVALLIAGEKRAAELGIGPLGRIERFAWAGCDPKRMGLGPVFAIERAGRPAAEADVIEINEAFAAQTLAVLRKLGLGPDERINPAGGAIALGHPVGASGARIVLSCLNELHRRNARHGLAALCIGGGQGGAVWLERT